MSELGVNIDHVATIRQARRTYEPDPVWAATEAHLGGADAITVHLREDRRHIQDHDVRRLAELVHVKLNLEMAATDEMVGIATEVRPQMASLVPEGRQEITTEGGLDVAAEGERLAGALERLHGAGVVVCAFIDAEEAQIEAARRLGFDACEVHTGPYAGVHYRAGRREAAAATVQEELERVRRAGELIQAAGMRFHAGHALTYANVQPIAAMPGVRELHIGHSIVSRAVFIGLREAVAEMRRLIRDAPRLTEPEACAAGGQRPGGGP